MKPDNTNKDKDLPKNTILSRWNNNYWKIVAQIKI